MSIPRATEKDLAEAIDSGYVRSSTVVGEGRERSVEALREGDWRDLMPYAAARRVLEKNLVIPLDALPDIEEVKGWYLIDGDWFDAEVSASERWRRALRGVAAAVRAEGKEMAEKEARTAVEAEREKGVEALLEALGGEAPAAVIDVLRNLYDAGVRAP